MWCWRCQAVYPMMDEDEFAEASKLYGQIFKVGKKVGFEMASMQVSEYYYKLSGISNVHANVVMHHRISLYGPPCPSCGKPYRTPLASFCAACGHKRIVKQGQIDVSSYTLQQIRNVGGNLFIYFQHNLYSHVTYVLQLNDALAYIHNTAVERPVTIDIKLEAGSYGVDMAMRLKQLEVAQYKEVFIFGEKGTTQTYMRVLCKDATWRDMEDEDVNR